MGMTRCLRYFLAAALCQAVLVAQPAPYAWSGPARDGGTLAERFPAPAGYSRDFNQNPFAIWLRDLPLRAGNPEVMLFDGRPKNYQEAHLAVVAIDTGSRDLQQCADAVMRLRAEYLWSADRRDEIKFNFTSGDAARWSSWQAGQRPKINGNKVRWVNSSAKNDSYKNFRRYLNIVFSYAGSHSLARELKAVSDPTQVQPGDVFIQGGFPGHAVMVLDVVENQAGERMFMVGQSYMPAQDFHVLKNPKADGVWYPARAEGKLRTPEWTFDYSDLKRFENP